MPKLQAITFDFWNTLYTEGVETMRQRGRLRAERFRQVMEDADRPCSIEAAAEAVEDAGRTLALALGARLPMALCMRLAEAVSDPVVEVPPTMDPHAPAVLERLAGDYRLGIVSDTGLSMGASLRLVLAADGILKYFRSQTFSNEVGAAKPKAAAFADACGKLGVRPADSLHVGDMEQTDMVGAKAFGMWAVRIDRNGTPDGTVADAVVRSLAELPEVIEHIEGKQP